MQNYVYNYKMRPAVKNKYYNGTYKKYEFTRGNKT